MTGQEFIAYAKKYLGKNGSFVWSYYGLTSGTAWCAAFVSYIFDKKGYKAQWYNGKPVFYVPYAQQWCEANWEWVKLADAKAGDVVIFTWDGNGNNSGHGSRDHIGFVRESSDTSDYLLTIEGNKDSKVCECKRAKKWIYGIYRPPFLNGEQPQPKDYHLTVDGVWGSATTTTIQHLLGVDEDGELGKQTIKAVQEYCNEQLDKHPPEPKSANEKCLEAVAEFAEKIANDNSYDYKRPTTNAELKNCPICNDIFGKKTQCIGFVGMCLKHGGGINVSCACNGIVGGTETYGMFTLDYWKRHNGSDWIEVTGARQRCDVCVCFNKDNSYQHTAFYWKEGYVCDATSGSGIAIRKDTLSAYKVKCFRYTGSGKFGESTYQGTFPNYNVTSTITHAEMLAKMAEELAWATNTKKADYPNGNPTTAFKNALPIAYPEHNSWGKAPSVGASCDVAVGTCIRAAGLDPKFPRGLDEQFKYLKTCDGFDYMKASESNLKRGCLIIYSNTKGGHICIYLGNGKVAEAGYEHYWLKTTPYASERVNFYGAKIYHTTGESTTTRKWLQKGDKGDEIIKLQNFLNWYGDYGLDADGDFGASTESAVKAFQKDNGLTVDGEFGSASLAKAKAVVK